jgi:hypothetical protein
LVHVNGYTATIIHPEKFPNEHPLEEEEFMIEIVKMMGKHNQDSEEIVFSYNNGGKLSITLAERA